MRENCNNGVDDDNDGAIDCADRKCVTTPACGRFACRADVTVGLLPLDGSPRSVVVQTAMAGDDQHATSCASAPGGQDGVIDFQVPATADVTMQWAQVGDHDFALYDDEGMAARLRGRYAARLRRVRRDGDRRPRLHGAAAGPLPPGGRRRPAGPRRRRGVAAIGRRRPDAVDRGAGDDE